MKAALADTPLAHMKQPDGLVTVRIDKTTGQLAKPGAKNAMFEIYREELAPTEIHSLNTKDISHLNGNEDNASLEDIF